MAATVKITGDVFDKLARAYEDEVGFRLHGVSSANLVAWVKRTNPTVMHVQVSGLTRDILFVLHFTNKDDAAIFKLTWA